MSEGVDFSKALHIDPKELNDFDPDNKESLEKYKAAMKHGIAVGQPQQGVVGARVVERSRKVWADAEKKEKISKPYKAYEIQQEPFKKQFYILFQISKETPDGSRWDFRVFFRDVNGRRLMQKIGLFCFEFVDEYFEPIKGEFEPPISATMSPGKVRWQQDFICLNIPGRYIEMIFDKFFEHLYRVFS